ncbi:MAG: LuxR C-terminal-related transcriptional regulator [Clostridium sp.]|nr:LuxR C-terminal-related transcriptional regulator [Clostridium sp.]
MRQLTVAIHLPSPLLRIAVGDLLKRQRDFSTTIVDIPDPAAAVGTDAGLLDEKGISLLLADTSLTPPSLIEYARREWNAPVVGIVTGAPLPQVTRLLDDTASIYDPAEKILTIIRKHLESEKAEPQKELSPREKEIVVGIVKGLSNKEIANEINVSVNTVMTHRRNIAAKLQIHSTAGLTIYALVSNLVTLEEAKSGSISQ